MIRAKISGRRFASACAAGISGKVHSVFDRAVNVEVKEHDADVSLMTLLCSDSDVMPASLVTSLHDESWRDYCKIGDHVIFTNDVIYINSVPVVGGVSEAELWEGMDAFQIKKLPKLSYEEIGVRCRSAEAYIEKAGAVKSAFPVTTLPDLNPAALLGLGDGLTPAGDDFLAGLLHAIHFSQILYGRKSERLPAIAGYISENMISKTNQISRHFLRYALDGLWGRATELFLSAVFLNNDERLFEAIDEKLSYGASSGLDEMTGILFGLRESVRLFENSDIKAKNH